MVETLTYDALSSNTLQGAVVGIGDADSGIIWSTGIIDPGYSYEECFSASLSFSARQPVFDRQTRANVKAHGRCRGKARSQESSETRGHASSLSRR